MTPKAVMVGLPGSGKSTIGRRLARALQVDLLDTDVAIEQRTGRTIADIFANEGESEFRRIEEEVVLEALASHDGVISLGGGAITIAGVREALLGHTVVYLEMSANEGVRRTGRSTVRPLFVGVDRAEKFRSLVTERVPLYRRVATVRVNTNRRNPGAVLRYVLSRLENPRPVSPSRRRRACRRPAAVTEQPDGTPPTPATQAALAARSAENRR